MNQMSDPVTFEAWSGFSDGEWRQKVDVRGFIQENYTPYEGDSAFLAGRPNGPHSFGKNLVSC